MRINFIPFHIKQQCDKNNEKCQRLRVISFVHWILFQAPIKKRWTALFVCRRRQMVISTEES